MTETDKLLRAVEMLTNSVDRLTQQSQAIVKQNNQLILLMAGETVDVDGGDAAPRLYLNGKPS